MKVLDDEPGQILLPECGELSDLHYLQHPLDPVLKGIFVDELLLCRQGDSVLYVVRRDWARESQVLDNVSALHERDVTLTGFIFNGASRRGSGYGYGYGYGYGKYGYGYGYGTRKK